MSLRRGELLRIEPAGPGLAEELSALALRSKRSWGYPEAWLEAWRPDLTLSPEYLRDGAVHAAYLGSVLAGFHALSRREDRANLEHLWVDPDSMGRGVGRRLLEHALGRARELGARRLEIESDPNAESFYRRHGAVRIGAVPAPVCGETRELPLLQIDLERSDA